MFAAQPGASIKMAPGVWILLEIFVFFCKRMSKLHFAAPVWDARGELALHDINVVSIPCLPAQLGTIGVGLEISRPKLNRAVIVGFCLGQTAEKALHGGAVEPEDVLRGIATQRLGVGVQSALIFTDRAVKRPNGIEQLRGIGSRPFGTRGALNALSQPAFGSENSGVLQQESRV